MFKGNDFYTTDAAPIFYKEGLKIEYKKGQVFTRPEDTSQGMYYLDSGQVLVHTAKSDGLEQVVAVFEKGVMFGKPGSLMPQRITLISITALTDCVAYRLSGEKFNKHPQLLMTYMRQATLNYLYLLNQILVLGERNIYNRVISELLLMADYYGNPQGKGVTLRVALTQEQLSNMLCITREYLSKTLKKIKTKKLITIGEEGRVTIPDITILQRELGLQDKLFIEPDTHLGLK